MIVDCIWEVFKFAIIAVVFIALGYIITFFLYGSSLSTSYLEYALFKLNGCVVFSVGFGLMSFVHKKSNNITEYVKHIIDANVNDLNPFLHYMYNSSSYNKGLLFAVPISIYGVLTVYLAGFPLSGFPKAYLFIFTIAIYFAASQTLNSMVNTIRAFHAIDLNIDKYSYNTNNQIFYDSLNTLLITSSTLGLLAVYLGFRGIVTAGFINLASNDLLEKLLTLPLLLFFVAPLALSFYPRYALRRIYERSILLKVDKLEAKIEAKDYLESIQAKKMVLEIKDMMLKDGNRPPIISLKDSGSAFLILLIILQLIANNDIIIKEYISSIVG